MRRQNKIRTSGCPLAYGLDIFGDRWSILIIREMMLKGNKTYTDFFKIEEGIATNILATRLKFLQDHGIIKKSRDPDNRRSFIYSLTEKGRDLAPILVEIIVWSGKYDKRPLALRSMLKKIRKNRTGFESSIRSG